MKRQLLFLTAVCIVEFFAVRPSRAQSPAERVVALRVEPAEADGDIGEDLHFKAVALDASGNPVTVPVTWFAVPWDLGSADASGVVRPQAPGLLRVGAKVGEKVAYARVMVRPWRVSQVEIQPSELTVVAEGHAQLSAIPRATNGNPRREIPVEWTSETPAIATVDAAGLVTGVRAGQAVLRASADGVVSKVEVDVIANPARQLTVAPNTTRARTGDVVHFAAQVPAGALPKSVQATWSVQGEGAAIWPDGGFVAEKPGTYVVNAEIGRASCRERV